VAPPALSLEGYRRLTLAGSVLGAVLFGAGLVVLIESQDIALALGLVVAGAAAALGSTLVQVEGAPPALPPSLLLLTRRECALCEEARALLEALRAEHPFDLWVVDVDAAPELRERHGARVPVALRGEEEVFALAYDEARVRAALGLTR
jgi:hypothetical protein